REESEASSMIHRGALSGRVTGSVPSVTSQERRLSFNSPELIQGGTQATPRVKTARISWKSLALARSHPSKLCSRVRKESVSSMGRLPCLGDLLRPRRPRQDAKKSRGSLPVFLLSHPSSKCAKRELSSFRCQTPNARITTTLFEERSTLRERPEGAARYLRGGRQAMGRQAAAHFQARRL